MSRRTAPEGGLLPCQPRAGITRSGAMAYCLAPSLPAAPSLSRYGILHGARPLDAAYLYILMQRAVELQYMQSGLWRALRASPVPTDIEIHPRRPLKIAKLRPPTAGRSVGLALARPSSPPPAVHSAPGRINPTLSLGLVTLFPPFTADTAVPLATTRRGWHTSGSPFTHRFSSKPCLPTAAR